jgi:hypothetical protein
MVMGNPLKIGLVLLAVAAAVLGSVLFLQDPTIEGGSSADEAVSGAVERAGMTGGAGDDEGFAGMAAKTVKKGGAGSSGASPDVVLGEVESSRAREDYVNAMFRPLAGLGVEVAMARVRQLPDEASRDMAMLALLGEWSGQSVTELAQRGEVGRFGVAGALGLYMMNEGKMTPVQTAALANEFLTGQQRGSVLSRAAEKLAATDPTTALAMGDGLADWQQVRFLSRFVSGWASAAPEDARAWAGQVEDPRTRSVLLGRVLAEEVKVNPMSAAQTFLEAPPEDAQTRERTARQIAANWAAKDTVAAMQWANNLPEGNDRAAAQRGINSTAPVGIGARLSRGEDGVPVLQELVPGSPASASGQLRSGDRLLAVSDAGGSWVNSRDMSIGDVVGMIQGDPQTPVSIQVQSADGSAPRVVTLQREQIIHRPGS